MLLPPYLASCLLRTLRHLLLCSTNAAALPTTASHAAGPKSGVLKARCRPLTRSTSACILTRLPNRPAGHERGIRKTASVQTGPGAAQASATGATGNGNADRMAQNSMASSAPAQSRARSGGEQENAELREGASRHLPGGLAQFGRKQQITSLSSSVHGGGRRSCLLPALCRRRCPTSRIGTASAPATHAVSSLHALATVLCTCEWDICERLQALQPCLRFCPALQTCPVQSQPW